MPIKPDPDPELSPFPRVAGAILGVVWVLLTIVSIFLLVYGSRAVLGPK